jgi:hypothetical protein
MGQSATEGESTERRQKTKKREREKKKGEKWKKRMGIHVEEKRSMNAFFGGGL